jgi:Ca2+-dependent lipid-binding protein
VKRNRTLLSITEKLEIIDKLESRVPVANVVDEYGIGLITVKDLKREKDKIRKFSLKFQVGSEKVKSAKKKHSKCRPLWNLKMLCIRGDADKSLARPTSRCRRTES